MGQILNGSAKTTQAPPLRECENVTDSAPVTCPAS